MLETLIKQVETNIEAQQKELDQLRADKKVAEKVMIRDNELEDNSSFVFKNDEVGTHHVTVRNNWLYVEPIEIVTYESPTKATSDENLTPTKC
jgi:hypothetical protein